MKIKLIQVPYHLGKKAVGMGLGPIHFMKSNLVQNLLDQGHELIIESIQPSKLSGDEITAVIELNNLLKSSDNHLISSIREIVKRFVARTGTKENWKGAGEMT